MDPITEFSALVVVLFIAAPSILMLCCILDECPMQPAKGGTLEDVPFFFGCFAMSDCTSPATASLVCFFFVVFVLMGFSAFSGFFFMLWRGSVLEKQSGDVDLPDTISNLALLQTTGPLVRGGVAVLGSHAQAHAVLTTAATLLNGSRAAAMPPGTLPRMAAAALPRQPVATMPPPAAAVALLRRASNATAARRGAERPPKQRGQQAQAGPPAPRERMWEPSLPPLGGLWNSLE